MPTNPSPASPSVSPIAEAPEATSFFDMLAADYLAGTVCDLVDRGIIDARSAAGDALLDYASSRHGHSQPIVDVRRVFNALRKQRGLSASLAQRSDDRRADVPSEAAKFLHAGKDRVWCVGCKGFKWCDGDATVCDNEDGTCPIQREPDDVTAPSLRDAQEALDALNAEMQALDDSTASRADVPSGEARERVPAWIVEYFEAGYDEHDWNKMHYAFYTLLNFATGSGASDTTSEEADANCDCAACISQQALKTLSRKASVSVHPPEGHHRP